MTKIPSRLLILLCSASIPFAIFGAPLEYWEFDDAAGTDLDDLSNSGSLGSSWNFNTAPANIGGAGHVTNGSGLYVIDGGTSTFTRKLPAGANEGTNNEYATPITTGIYTLEVNFHSWDMTGFNVGDSWKVGINNQNTGGNTIAQIILEKNAVDSTRLRAATYLADTTGAFRNFDYGLTVNTAQTLAIEFDFDNDTVRYLQNGSETHSFNNFGGDQMGQMIYVLNGTWGGSGTINIDSMGVIPEPSSLILLGSALAGLLMYRRRT